MKIITLLLALAALTTGAYAGPMGSMPAPYSSQPSPVFNSGFHLGAHALFLTPQASRAEDTWGGGLNADYFFSPYVGVQFSGAWADPGTGEIWHNYTVDLVLRAPIESLHLAPYVFVGGGAIVEDDVNVLGRAGVGLEYRPTAKFGIFADWVYNFPGGGGYNSGTGTGIRNYQLIRMGVKFGF